jgi:dihydropteroate synthase
MNRILICRTLSEAKAELAAIHVSSQGVEVMAPKAVGTTIKLTGVRVGAANILKQEMLAIGADAAVARGVVDGKVDTSDVILLGNPDKIRKLIHRLDYQTIFGLPKIQEFLRSVLPLMEDVLEWSLPCRGRELHLPPTHIMGIVNVTPDSFSDGGKYLDPDKAVEHARELIDAGADILDLGAESTRPGSEPVDEATQIARLIPVITAIRTFSDIPLSVDTTRAAVIHAALDAGADILNDVSALRDDPAMTSLLASHLDVPVVLMHMQGVPRTMQEQPRYTDVLDEVLTFFAERIDYCALNGIDPQRIILDPGIGFGKTTEHNLVLLKHCRELMSLGRPVMIAHSRKRFIDAILHLPPERRDNATLAVSAYAATNGIPLVRVHDVRAHREALTVLSAVLRTGEAKWVF